MDSNKPVRLVLAGNHKQAEQYAHKMEWKPTDWRYLSCVGMAFGYRDVELHKVGTWYERKDAPGILYVLRATTRTLIRHDDVKSA